MTRLSVNLIILTLAMLFALDIFAEGESDGQFVRSYHYQKGIEHGNPKYDGRFRVNGPESVTGRFHTRNEIRENGAMQILMSENLLHLRGAELDLEIWGGHPGTTNKRVTINGRSTYLLADETEFHHCTYCYHTIPLKLTDLTFAGYNAIQFACDTGSTFWGIFIVDRATLNAIYSPEHPYLEEAGLGDFSASVDVEMDEASETFRIALDIPERFASRIDRVDFIGYYTGYNDNGANTDTSWHGMTKWGEPYGILGTAVWPELAIEFDYSMVLPSDFKVKAVVHFKDEADLTYRVGVRGDLKIPKRSDNTVLRLVYPTNTPAPMWSRAGREKSCTIIIITDVSLIKRAQLHMKIWDGGAGEVEHPITFNGQPIIVGGEGKHDLIYKVVDIDPSIIKRANVIRVLSDTLHHGIEVIYPGPALVIRRDNPTP